jgi:hypothetical protein
MLEVLKDHSELPLVKALWSRALGGEEFVEVDAFGDPSSDRRYYEMRFRVLRGEKGEALGAFQFVTDVTERLREQNRLKEAEEALRQSQKMEAMGQLTGGVAHDFNNLLTPIIGSLDMLVRRGVGSERERRLIDGALQSAERAKTLVQRLLAFARRQPLQPVSVEIPRLVEGMVGLIGSTLGPTIDLRVDLAAELPPAKADPNQLEMALLNLAVNARDAMPAGGELRIRAQRERLRQAHASGIMPGHMSCSASPTPGRVWTSRRASARSSRSFRPRAWARAPDWDCRWSTGSRRSSAAGWRSRASPAKGRRSSFGSRSALCRPAERRRRRRSHWRGPAEALLCLSTTRGWCG